MRGRTYRARAELRGWLSAVLTLSLFTMPLLVEGTGFSAGQDELGMQAPKLVLFEPASQLSSATPSARLPFEGLGLDLAAPDLRPAASPRGSAEPYSPTTTRAGPLLLFGRLQLEGG